MSQRKVSSSLIVQLNICRSRQFKGQIGFTLVEMLVVLGILGLIVGLVGPRVVNYLADSKKKAAVIQMENIASALELYYLDNSGYPTSQEGLTALIKRPLSSAGWNGPYLKSNTALNDPWGRPYIYKAPGDKQPFDLSSLGPTGEAPGRLQLNRGSTDMR